MTEVSPCDAVGDAGQQGAARVRHGGLDVLHGAGGAVDVGVVRPALDRAEGLVGRGLDLRGLLDEPADDQEDDPDGDRHQGEQHQPGPRRAGEAAAGQPRDAGGADRGHHGAGHDRLDDRGGEAEDPDDPHDDRGDADQQPRDAAEAAQPSRRHEHPRDVARRDLGDRGARLPRRHRRPEPAEELHRALPARARRGALSAVSREAAPPAGRGAGGGARSPPGSGSRCPCRACGARSAAGRRPPRPTRPRSGRSR